MAIVAVSKIENMLASDSSDEDTTAVVNVSQNETSIIRQSADTTYAGIATKYGTKTMGEWPTNAKSTKERLEERQYQEQLRKGGCDRKQDGADRDLRLRERHEVKWQGYDKDPRRRREP